MKYIIVMLTLAGCGASVNVNGLHDVKVIHEISVDNLLPYIRAYCQKEAEQELGDQLPNYPNAVENCVQIEVGQLINKL